MEKNFEGKQFKIPEDARKGYPTVDCMFFPATHGDEIQIDPSFKKNM